MKAWFKRAWAAIRGFFSPVKAKPIEQKQSEVLKVPAPEEKPKPVYKPSIDLVRFIDNVERHFGRLKSSQIDGFIVIERAITRHGITNVDQQANIYAQIWHESNRTMQSVKEAYWLSEDWRKKNLRYYPWYGRGPIQITWEPNYAKMGKALGIDLVSNPDKLLEPDVGADSAVIGMRDGLFTGKKLSHYFNESKNDPIGARRIVNGRDKAEQIAGYHSKFLEALKKSQVKPVTSPELA